MFFKHFQYFLIPILAIETRIVTIKDCPFSQTVDLLDSTLLSNGSYLYKNHTIIPPELVGDYIYTILIDDTSANDLKTHKRGCVCAVKQCLRFCNNMLEQFYEKFKNDDDIELAYTKKVTLHNGLSVSKHLIYDFYPIYGNVCALEMSYMLKPELKSNNGWTLYEDSMLLLHYDKRNLSLDDYCFRIDMTPKYEYLVNPVVCGKPVEISWFNIWAMTFSIPFLIGTIICYKCLINKDNISKCFQIYLSFLTVSYTLICFYSISGIKLPSIACEIFGFTFYLTTVSYLTWTCILSYDTWKAITTINDSRPSFSAYSKVGYTIPLCMTFVTFVGNYSDLPDDWTPGISSDLCAVDTKRWSALIYYYIPCIGVFIFTLTLYIKIVVFKRKHSTELHNLFGHGPGPLSERFSFFFRTFLLMGISWSLDIFKYFVRQFGVEQAFIYLIFDLFNAFYGVFVFFTFICRPSILKKLKNWFQRKFSRSKA